MEQMYKVFYNDVAIIFTEDEAEIKSCNVVKRLSGRPQMHDFLKTFFRKKKQEDVCLTGYSIEKLFSDFKVFFKQMDAAGGLVKNRDGNYLLIKRFDIWDLPKGKVEKGEHAREAALREVEEETGVEGLKITGELPFTYHIYGYKDKIILKKTHWFLMKTDYTGKLTPQQQEDITDAVWLNPEKSRKALKESYRSLYETLYALID